MCEYSHRDYIGVESEPYECGTRTSANRPPCPAWSLGDARCFMCDQKCEEMHDVRNPRDDISMTSATNGERRGGGLRIAQFAYEQY